MADHEHAPLMHHRPIRSYKPLPLVSHRALLFPLLKSIDSYFTSHSRTVPSTLLDYYTLQLCQFRFGVCVPKFGGALEVAPCRLSIPTLFVR